MGTVAHRGGGEDLASPLSSVFSSSASFSPWVVAFSPWSVDKWDMRLALRCCCRSYATWELTPSWVGASVVGAKCGNDDLAGKEYSPGPIHLPFVVVIARHPCVAFMSFAVLSQLPKWRSSWWVSYGRWLASL